jgi:4-diphosphocytidyl-2-C-methyl-D-erythritol kinase
LRPIKEPAPAKLNLALHVRGKLADGRHRLETLFAFCVDGDILSAEPWDRLEVELAGPFSAALDPEQPTSVEVAARQLAEQAGLAPNVRIRLDKKLPVASGIGGGSADAAATLRLLTGMWKIDPGHASTVAPRLGSDVPACLLSMTARGEEAGDALQLVTDAFVSGLPVLLVNPLIPLSTRDVFARWDGVDRGPLGDWREGRNDLEDPARELVPAISGVLEWLRSQPEVDFVRMSGSGATCFALFETESGRDAAAARVPGAWWHMASFLR